MQFAQVVDPLAGRVVGVGPPGSGADLGGEPGDGEPVGDHRQRQDGGQRSTGSGPVQVNPADPGGADLGRDGQFVEDAVGDDPQAFRP